MSRFVLVPISEGERKEIKVPENLYTAPSIDQDLLNALCKANVKNINGKVCCDGNLLNLDFYKCVSDCQSGIFLEKYEPIYEKLNSIGYDLDRLI